MSIREDVPVAMVMWPNGIKAIVQIAPGDRSVAGREALIRVYRAAERGSVGLVALGDGHD